MRRVSSRHSKPIEEDLNQTGGGAVREDFLEEAKLKLMENACLPLEEEEKALSQQREHPTGRGLHVLGDSGGQHMEGVCACVHACTVGVGLRSRAEASQGH